MVLIESFQFPSFFWLSFQRAFPWRSCSLSRWWALVGRFCSQLRRSALCTCTSPSLLLLRVFYADSYLDMPFIKSPRFPEKTPFFQSIRIPKSTPSPIQFGSALTHRKAYAALGSWSAESGDRGSQSAGRSLSVPLSAPHCHFWHLISLNPVAGLTFWINDSSGHLAINYLSQLGRGWTSYCAAYPMTWREHCHHFCVSNQ